MKPFKGVATIHIKQIRQMTFNTIQKQSIEHFKHCSTAPIKFLKSAIKEKTEFLTAYVFNERFITHEQYREFKSDYDNSIKLMEALKSVYPL